MDKGVDLVGLYKMPSMDAWLPELGRIFYNIEFNDTLYNIWNRLPERDEINLLENEESDLLKNLLES